VNRRSTQVSDSPPEKPALYGSPLLEAIYAPLLELREQYVSAMDAMQTVVDRIDPLVAGSPRPARPQPPLTIAGLTQGPAIDVELDVSAAGQNALAGFEEALAQVPGVQRVSLKHFGDGKATFAVELRAAGAAAPPEEEGFSVVCAWCGKLLTLGGARISHGLCADCAAQARAGSTTATRRPEAPAAPTAPAAKGELVYILRSGNAWIERRRDARGAWEEAPTGFSIDTPAHEVLERLSGKYPDRLVVVSGEGGETLASGMGPRPVSP
jgi:hypothetical protein